jgi:uncharacterized protein DUF4255
MANQFAIHSVGESLRKYLENSYPQELLASNSCAFRLVSSGELKDPSSFGTTLSLYLYRVTMNEHLRNTLRVNDPSDAKSPLAVDLHYLMTVWANNALAEHTILCWAMRQLYQHPVLDNSSLSPEAGWTTADLVQLIPAELSNEEVMRIWDALDPPYHLSVSYVARVVRIDADAFDSARPAVAKRFSYMDREVPA